MNKLKVKVLVVGDAGVGKTTLLQMYLSNGQNYVKDYIMTPGVDIQAKLILGENGQKDLEFYFFDTSGHSLYKSVVNEVYKESQAVLLVYDCTNKASFDSLQTIYDAVKKANGGKDILGVVVSTKNDLTSIKKVQFAEGSEFAKRNNKNFVEVSAVSIKYILGYALEYTKKLNEIIPLIYITMSL